MTLSVDEDLLALVTSDSFIRRVRRASVTLSNTGLISNEDIIDIAIEESFPRVFLVLAATKSKKGSDVRPVLGGLGPNSDYDTQYREVRRVVFSSVYSEGIQRVVAALTSAVCIKHIPLNSDIELFNLGKHLEEQALADLDRIIGLIEVTGAEAIDNTATSLANLSFYFASSIDKSYLSEDIFNKVKGKSASLDNVQLNQYITVKPGYKAFCWYYITGTSVTRQVESGFFIEDMSSVEEVVQVLSQSINESCIEKSSTLISSPNRGEITRETLSYKKIEIYPSTESEPNKELSFTISTRIHYITFSSRLLSSSYNKELISVKLYQLPIEQARDIDEAISNRYSPLSEPIEGVVYGTKNSYYSLDDQGPHSLLIDVEKGAAASDLSMQKDQIDTVYFRLKEGCDSSEVKGNLGIRIASPPLGEYTDWDINIEEGSSPEEVSFTLLSSLYERHVFSKLLGSMPHSNAVQIIPFLRTDEVTNMVLDITAIPECLEIATGTSFQPLTQFKSQPRSITVKTIVNPFSGGNEASTASPHGATVTAPINKSKRLQSVFDKIDFLSSVNRNNRRQF
jgi:hypothetical protein